MEGESAHIEFRLLGPLEVVRNGAPVPLRRGRQSALLAILLLHANRVASIDGLIDGLWPESPPATAGNALQVYVSRLRKALGGESATDDRLLTTPRGYVLHVDRDELDIHRFERVSQEGRAALARSPGVAAEKLREALALWRGPPLADFASEEFAQAEIARLEELRLAAVADRIDADLALGRHAELVGELEALAAENPLSERFRRQLILALYRSGRQADALEEHRRVRALLVEELGIDPGIELRRLERSILEQDPALEAPPRAGAPAGNLPVAASPLIGREVELDHAAALLTREEVRLVTLTGPGGIGKTRLGMEVARRVARAFEDGAFFVDLSSVSKAALVAPAIGDALGLGRDGGTEPAPLDEFLRDRSVLLVMDNFEQVLSAAPLLAVLLGGAPGLTLLVTSRTTLRISGEYELAVPPLELPGIGAAHDAKTLSDVASVALFVQRAAAVADFQLTDDNAAAVAEICAALDGLPLAIELAAARTKVLTPAAIVARLGRRLELLTAGSRSVPRQETLRRTLDWSFQLLGEDDQRLFARLAVFRGGFTLDAAETICGDEGTVVLDGLASLVDSSLLGRLADDSRFAMLETIREYALEKLAASGEHDALRRRHLRFYLALAEEGESGSRGPEQASWLERLETEHGNLRASLAFAMASGDGETALRLATALHRFWRIHGHLVEGRRRLAAALALAPDAPRLMRAKALNGIGILAGEQGDFGGARTYFEASLQLARELEDPERIGAALSNVGNLALYEGDYERANSAYTESLELQRQVGNYAGAAIALENLGCVALAQGNGEAAVSLLEEAEGLGRRGRDRHVLASVLRELGRALLDRGDLDRARAALEESLSLDRQLGQRHGIAECLEALGALEAARGGAERASTLFGAADALRESFGARTVPDVRNWYTRWLEAARERLEADTFAEGYERGRELNPDEAIELALEPERDGRGSAP